MEHSANAQYDFTHYLNIKIHAREIVQSRSEALLEYEKERKGAALRKAFFRRSQDLILERFRKDQRLRVPFSVLRLMQNVGIMSYMYCAHRKIPVIDGCR